MRKNNRQSDTDHYYAGSQRVVSKIGSSPEVGNFLKSWSLQTQIGGEIPINQIKESERIYKNAFDSKVSVYEKWKIPSSNRNGGYSDYGTEVSNSISNNIQEKDKYFYHSDHLGSTSYITDSQGNVTQHHEYIPFGETFVSEYKNAGYNSPYRFNSKEFDSNTGFYYYGARYYNPKTSLWISVDPLADFNPFMNSEHYIDGQHNGGVLNHFNSNPYSYCYQNPVLYVDPNGKQAVAGAIIGAAIGAFTEYIGIIGNKMLFQEMSFEEANKSLTWQDVLNITVAAGVGSASGVIDNGIGHLARWVSSPMNKKILKFMLQFGVSAIEGSIKEIYAEGDFNLQAVLAGALTEVGMGNLLGNIGSKIPTPKIMNKAVSKAESKLAREESKLSDLSSRRNPHQRLINNQTNKVEEARKILDNKKKMKSIFDNIYNRTTETGRTGSSKILGNKVQDENRK